MPCRSDQDRLRNRGAPAIRPPHDHAHGQFRISHLVSPAPPSRRPRPVAGLPALDGEALARAWLLALVDGSPSLAEAGALPIDVVAADGPGLCAAVLRALGDDVALDALGRAGTPLLRALGGQAPARLRAAEALRCATWRALRAALGPDEDPALVADAADRLAHACHLLALAAIEDAVPVSHLDVLARALAAGPTCSILAAEVPDALRLGAAGRDLSAAFAAAALRAGDDLVPAADGRFWVVAPGADADGARGLAHALAQAAPHGLALGIATAPDDGTDAAALADLADERLLAALAGNEVR
jgi:hypothetical protein